MTALDRIFSDYRVEWADTDFRGRFVSPPYYREFKGSQPMFLVGGRGTGKTIALRSLHFRSTQEPGDPSKTGIYVKAHKNRVQSFVAEHVPEGVRLRAFEHYFNLMCCTDLAELCLNRWPSSTLGTEQRRTVQLVCEHFSIPGGNSLGFNDLYGLFRSEIAKLTRFVNDPINQYQPPLSAGELPVVEFAKDIHSLLEIDDPIYVCIDEWENLSEVQQESMNQWIKNSSTPVSYKIGVREGGIRTTRTGDGGDRLNSPADYVEKRIAGAEMTAFCESVAEMRLKQACRDDNHIPPTLKAFLPGLSRTEEARRLGAEKAIATVITSNPSELSEETVDWLQESEPADAYLAIYQAERLDSPLDKVVDDLLANPDSWRNVVGNYGHLSLFALTRGLGSVALQKYYCGYGTYLHLCGGNIRYLLELLDEAAILHIRELAKTRDEHDDRKEYVHQVPYDVQTRATVAVAKRHLDQIEGLSDQGLMIARLVRSLGTAFGALVREPRRKAPECMSFTLTGNPPTVDVVRSLIEDGCSILAFVSETLTKRTDVGEQLDDEYRIHPLLTPHFRMPYRHKRRASISANLLFAAATELGGAQRLYRELVGADIDDGQTDLLKN